MSNYEGTNIKVSSSSTDAIYGLAALGAAVYYVQQAVGFWASLLGILKGLFWPAIVLYKLMEYWKF
jgi:hypothetical protein